MSTNSLCLTCLSNASSGLLIPVPIAKFLQDVLRFEYVLQEGLPNLICLSCYKTLCGIKRFWVQLQDVKHYFNQTAVGVLRNNAVTPKDNLDSIANPTQHFNLETRNKSHSDGFFRCEKCLNLVFDNEELYRKHLQWHKSKTHSVNAKEKKFQCKVCEKRFLTLTEMRTHNITHKNLRPYICGLCPKTFRQKSGLSIHRFSHVAKNIVCPEPGCGRRYTNKHALISHSRIHQEPSAVLQHQCDVCLAKFGRLEDLQSHKLSHDERVKCEICGIMFCQGNLRFHIHTEHSETIHSNEDAVEFHKLPDSNVFSCRGISLADKEEEEELILG